MHSLNGPQKALQCYLEWLRDQTDLRSLGHAYRNPADFVLQHGRWYESQPVPRKLRRGWPPKYCFGNAIACAGYFGLRYVEGWAWPAMAGAGVPVQHAWPTAGDRLDRLYEITWPLPGLVYLGVEFSLERADDCTWNGDATVLDDRYRDWPLLREPWHGEPPGLVWPASERLEALRTRSAEFARQMMIGR